MPRYEYSDDKSNKFWEIELEGNSFTTRYGKIGSKGQSTAKSFGSEQEAQAAYDKAITSKTKKGYVLTTNDDSAAAEPTPPPSPKTYPDERTLEGAEAFIRNIEEAPNHIPHYLAYAAWLRTHNHPRAELIEVQHRLMQTPNNAKLQARNKELLDTHKELFTGAFGEFWNDNDMLFGQWYMGYIRWAKVRTTYERSGYHGQEYVTKDFQEFFSEFINHPSTQFLQELVVGLLDPEDNDSGDVDQALAERPRPTLRSLFLGDFYCEETELNWSSVTVNSKALYPMLPNLTSYTVRSGSLGFGQLNLPELREFRTISGGMGEDCVKHICESDCPKLERLSLQFGRRYENAATDVACVRPILQDNLFPHLRHLGITNAEFTDEFCEALADSPLLAQLDELDLKMGTMSAQGAKAIHDAKEKFAHLHFINVDDNYLPDESIALLRQVCPIFSDEQRGDGTEDPEDRYASAIE